MLLCNLSPPLFQCIYTCPFSFLGLRHPKSLERPACQVSISATSSKDDLGKVRELYRSGSWNPEETGVFLPVGVAAYSSLPLQNTPAGVPLVSEADPQTDNKPGPVWQSHDWPAGLLWVLKDLLQVLVYQWSLERCLLLEQTRQRSELPEMTPFNACRVWNA